MTLDRDADLMYLLGACGSALHDELKKLSGHHLVPIYADRPTHAWDHPPMFIRADLLGHPLSLIPALMFGHLVDHHDVEDVWMRCTTEMCDRASALPGFVARMLPDLPLNALRPVNVMVRVLALLSTKGGKLTFPLRQAHLTHEGTQYGISSLSVLTPIGGRRLKRPADLDTWTAINVIGTPRSGLSYLLSLEGHVAIWLPRLLTPLRILIGAAVHKGPEFQQQLLDCFDFDESRTQVVSNDPWDQARQIVTSASVNPIIELHTLLSPILGTVRFVKHFGNPHLAPATYSHRIREKHRDAIESLDGFIRTRGGVEPQDLHAAQALLNFQRQMGL